MNNKCSFWIFQLGPESKEVKPWKWHTRCLSKLCGCQASLPSKIQALCPNFPSQISFKCFIFGLSTHINTLLGFFKSFLNMYGFPPLDKKWERYRCPKFSIIGNWELRKISKYPSDFLNKLSPIWPLLLILCHQWSCSTKIGYLNWWLTKIPLGQLLLWLTFGQNDCFAPYDQLIHFQSKLNLNLSIINAQEHIETHGIKIESKSWRTPD